MVESVQYNEGFLELGLRRENVNLAEIAELAQVRGLSISSIRFRKPTLEDALFHCAGIPLREEQ